MNEHIYIEYDDGEMQQKEQIIRCKDCIHLTAAAYGKTSLPACSEHKLVMENVWGFCAWAERDE